MPRRVNQDAPSDLEIRAFTDHVLACSIGTRLSEMTRALYIDPRLAAEAVLLMDARRDNNQMCVRRRNRREREYVQHQLGGGGGGAVLAVDPNGVIRRPWTW